MDFTLSEEQAMFAQTARTLFADSCTPEHWRKLMETGQSRDPARWQAIVETGFTMLLLPESAGGLGLSELDFTLIAEAAGYVALPDPLAESAGIAAPMLGALAPDHPALADPAATVAIQHPINPLVADADSAAAILLHRDGKAFVAMHDQVRLTRRESIDPFRRLFEVAWDDAAPLGAADWHLALDRGALFVLIGVLLFFLLGFIIPRFSVVFDGMKNPSASAQLILWWGRLTQTHGSLLLAGCAAAVAGIVMAVRSPRLRQRALGLLLRIPALRQQHQLSVLVRFYRTLGLLLQGGLPAPDVLMLSREILPATHRQQVEQVIRDVAAGESLSRMLEAQQMTTPVASRLLQVGERSGELPAMCERIAAFYDESLERAIETFSKIFEPILMMVVGGIVGLVVFLLYMPIFELAGGLQ